MSFGYVPPEQAIKDKAEFARKGISRGKSVVAIAYDQGMLFVAENPSATLHKVSEIYDRIAFAAAGRYNEYEQLRVAGIRLADVKGYQYAREDVTGRSLANAYSSALGHAFTEPSKPLEVELLVAELTPDHGTDGESGDDVELYHILYDGSITDEEGHVAIGGSAESITTALSEAYRPGMTQAEALRVAHRALSNGGDIPPGSLEVAGLARSRGRRKFFRLTEAQITEALGTDTGAEAAGSPKTGGSAGSGET